MDRRIFGTWGQNLHPGKFCRALAACGLLPMFPPPPNAKFIARLLGDSVRNPGSDRALVWNPFWLHYGDWEETHELDDILNACADAWGMFLSENRPLRLEIDAFRYPNYGWTINTTRMLEALSASEVGAESIYIRRDEPSGEVRWNWPLRVGFLSDQASLSLHYSLGELLESGHTGWRKDYIQLCAPGQTGGLGCHILLLPSGLKKALASLSLTDNVVRAACVLVLGTAGRIPDADSALTAIRVQARAEGVALLDIPLTQLRSQFTPFFAKAEPSSCDLWAASFIQFVKNLSHNQTLDAALFNIWRSVGRLGLPPVVIASRRLIGESQISRRLARLAAQFRGPSYEKHTIVVGPENARLLDHPTGPTSLGELGQDIESRARNFGYDHEGDTGTATLNLLGAFRHFRQQETPRAPRWVQAYISAFLHLGDNKPRSSPSTRRVRSFQAGASYLVDVFVGPRDADAIQPPPKAPPLPEDDLPNDRGVTLTVVFAEASPERAPQVSTVFLPRLGRSENCRFAIAVPENAVRVEARIIVIYRNRVLQTSILSAQVAGGNDDDNFPISIIPEVVVRDTLEGLESRSDFDATIVLNHSEDGVASITAAQDDQAARFVLPEGIRELAKSFDGIMAEVADDAADFVGFQSKANVEMLIKMAKRGSMLWAAFDEMQPRNVDLTKCARIQVVSVNPSTRLPIEFFYDRKAPKDDARICPGAIAAMEAGGPCKECSSRSPDDASFVCPLAFWGLSKVLERHMYCKGERQTEDELRITTDPVGNRKFLSLGGPYLFAASAKVDAEESGGIARVRHALRQVSMAPSPEIVDWNEWSNWVGKVASSLLFIIPHIIQGDFPTLEIGIDSRLDAPHIDATHVRTPADREPAPIVVLLGCKTGTAAIPFSDLIGPLRRNGAAIVMCTGAPIVGRHAVRVAEALLEALKVAASAGIPKSFGDVLRDVRRAMVMRGLPMVFTVLAFGDFDWQLAKLPQKSTTEQIDHGGVLVTT